MAIVRPRKADGEYALDDGLDEGVGAHMSQADQRHQPQRQPERVGASKGDDAEPIYRHAPEHEETPREPVTKGGDEDGTA